MKSNLLKEFEVLSLSSFMASDEMTVQAQLLKIIEHSDLKKKFPHLFFFDLSSVDEHSMSVYS